VAKPSGRKPPRGYTPAGPPAEGVTVERVDAHTLIVRSAQPWPDDYVSWLPPMLGSLLRHPSVLPDDDHDLCHVRGAGFSRCLHTAGHIGLHSWEL
jgi:hypothetical protein